MSKKNFDCQVLGNSTSERIKCFKELRNELYANFDREISCEYGSILKRKLWTYLLIYVLS